MLAAPWIATLLVAAVGLNPALEGVGLTAPLPTAATFGVAAIVGLLALLALVLPTLSTGVSIAGVRVGGRAAGRPDAAAAPGPRSRARAPRGRRAVPAAPLRRPDHPQRPRHARRGPAAGRRARDRAAGRRGDRGPDRPAHRGARRAGAVPWARPRALDGRAPGRPPAAALHAGRAAAGARGRARDVRLRACRDVDAEPGRPGGVRLGGGRAPRARDPVGGARLGAGRGAAQPAGRHDRHARSWRRASASAPRCATAWSWGSTARPWPTSCANRTRRDAEATRASLRSLADGRPATPGLAVPDGTRRLSVVVDFDVHGAGGLRDRSRPATRASTWPPWSSTGTGGSRASRARSAALGVDGARSVIALAPPGTPGALTPPVHVLAIELELSFTGLPDTLASGVITVRALGTSPDPAGDALDRHARSRTSRRSRGPSTRAAGSVPYEPAQPGELVVASASPFSSTAWRLSFGRVTAPEIAALANPVFLERTGARVGDTLEASIFGLPVIAPAARRGRRRSRPSPRRSRCCWPTGPRWTSPAMPAA